MSGIGLDGRGGRWIGLRNQPGSIISQKISGLVPGRWYALSFVSALNPEVHAVATDLCVAVGGISNRFTMVLPVSSGEASGPVWRTNSMAFQAVGDVVALSLSSRGSGLVGPMVDELNLIAMEVPDVRRRVRRWHDLGRDYSASANPTGVWRLGWKATVEGTLTLLTIGKQGDEHGADYFAWQANEDGGAAIRSGVVAKPGAHLGSVKAAPGKGDGEERYCVARFTVPVGGAGSYRVETMGAEAWSGSGSCDAEFRILCNGQEMFGRILASRGATGFTNQMELRAGDTLDFVAGDGWNLADEGALVEMGVRIGLLEDGPVAGTDGR